MSEFFVQFRFRGAPTLTNTRVEAENIFYAVMRGAEHIMNEDIKLPCDELIVRLVRKDATAKKSRRTFTAEERRRLSGQT